jgi:hypothetical protein
MPCTNNLVSLSTSMLTIPSSLAWGVFTSSKA